MRIEEMTTNESSAVKGHCTAAITTHEDDGAIHINTWTYHEVILAVAEGGQFFSRNATSGKLDLWVLSEAHRVEALAKYGLGGTLRLDWVIKVFKRYLNPH